MNVSLPLTGRESVKLLKVDGLWAVDNNDDDGDVEKRVDESEKCFAILFFIYLHESCWNARKNIIFTSGNVC